MSGVLAFLACRHKVLRFNRGDQLDAWIMPTAAQVGFTIGALYALMGA